ncbi:MAG: LytTR family transcriptional regulator DNA-binding domain-containing protein [Enterocloster sp.]
MQALNRDPVRDRRNSAAAHRRYLLCGFCETVAHSICYHTLDGSAVTVRDTMDHAQELLGDRFIRCHRSVLVNQSHVLSLENGMLRLSNGEAVSCAFGKRKLMAGYCIRRKEFSDGC